jgi:putative membrane protein
MAIHRLLMAVAMTAVLALGQNDKTKDRSRDTTTNPSAAQKGTTNLSSDDRMFIQTVSEKGKHEVEMAKMGVQRASDAKVKSFAQRLVDDHTKANTELEELARKKNVTLTSTSTTSSKSGSSSSVDKTAKERTTVNKGQDPKTSTPTAKNEPSTTKTGDAAHDDLARLNGAEFDRAFVKQMLDAHQQAIPNWEKQQTATQDADLRNFIAKTLPTLRAHLDLAKSLDQGQAKSSREPAKAPAKSKDYNDNKPTNK